MRWADFAARYPREPYGGKVFEEKRQVLLESPREFAAFFGRLLHDRLMGEELGITLQEFDELWAEYVDWNNHYLGRTIRTLETLGPSGKRAEPLMEFGFHHLAQPLRIMWRSVLFDAPSPNRLEIRDLQILLSVVPYGIAAARNVRSRNSQYFAEYNNGFRALQSGLLAEFDATILLLGVCREVPDLWVIPAPPQFENSVPGRNVDLLLIDGRRKLVLGVQVKTALSEEAFRRYDSTGIVFLDSSRDFGNTVATRTRKRSSVVSSQPWPGLIAAHFCLALTDGPQMAQYRKASVAALFDSARAVWRTTAKGTRSGVRRAQKIVTERVLTAFAAAEKPALPEGDGA